MPNGSINDPWTYSYFMTTGSKYISPLNIIELRSGSYSGHYISTIKSIPKYPVMIRAYSGEHPAIDGTIRTNTASGVVWQGLEFYDADFTNRSTTDGGASPSGIPLDDGFRLESECNSVGIINCIIHDCRQGVLKDKAVAPSEFYGDLIYYNGWVAPDRGHGHGLYVANAGPDPIAIKDCIIHSNFGYNLHCYGEGGAPEYMKNIYVDGCVLFGSGAPINYPQGNVIGGSGGGATVRTSHMKNSYIKDDINIGWTSAGCTDFILQDCVIVGNLTMLYYYASEANKPMITGNKFYGLVTLKDGNNNQSVVDAPTLFPNNEYHVTGTPDGIYLHQNQYDSDRSNLIIFNGSSASTIEVDVSSLGWTGQVRARNVQDYFVDIQTLTISGGKITISMTGRTVATPQGWTAPASTFPQFGCFILEHT